ncbi:MAG: TonB-dependent copper receptor [Lacunisphaera sp.]
MISSSSFFPRKRAFGLAVALSSLLSGVNADDLVRLSPVVVLARSGENVLSAVVDPKAAAQPIPAQDGAEALRAIPGFNVIRKGGTDGDPVLRGMAGSRLGILLDGENILGGCGSRMDPPTAYVFPAAYDRITVLKGPQSVQYGPGNSAGVVLFERLPEQLSEPSIKADGTLTLGAFGRNDELILMRAGAPAGYVETTATRSTSGDYSDGDGQAVHSRYERWSVHAGAGWTPNRDTLVELTGIISDGEAAYADRMMDGAQFTRKNLGLHVRHAFTAGHLQSLEMSAFVNAVDHVMDNYSLRVFSPSMMMPGKTVSNPDRLTSGGRIALTFAPAEITTVTIGVDQQDNRHRLRGSNNEATDPFEAKTRLRDATFDVTGAFTEAAWKITPDRRLVGGARADFWQAQDFRDTVAVGMMSSAKNPSAGQTRRETLASGFIRYEHDLPLGTTAFIGAGYVERFPDYWEIFSKESATSVSAFATKAERTGQIDAGLTRRAGPLVVSVSLFANRVGDMILIQSGVMKPSGMTGTRAATIARNIDAASRGGEASVVYRLTSGWRGELSATYVRGENKTDAVPLAQQPPLEGRAGLSYSAVNWTVGTLGRFVAAQNRFSLNQGNIVGQDLGPSAGFAVFSINAGWKPTTHTQLTIGVDNLFDRTYAEHLSRGGSMVAGFPVPTIRVNEPGRTWWLKAEMKW